jgi:hypothetical protein
VGAAAGGQARQGVCPQPAAGGWAARQECSGAAAFFAGGLALSSPSAALRIEARRREANGRPSLWVTVQHSGRAVAQRAGSPRGLELLQRRRQHAFGSTASCPTHAASQTTLPLACGSLTGSLAASTPWWWACKAASPVAGRPLLAAGRHAGGQARVQRACLRPTARRPGEACQGRQDSMAERGLGMGAEAASQLPTRCTPSSCPPQRSCVEHCHMSMTLIHTGAGVCHSGRERGGQLPAPGQRSAPPPLPPVFVLFFKAFWVGHALDRAAVAALGHARACVRACAAARQRAHGGAWRAIMRGSRAARSPARDGWRACNAQRAVPGSAPCRRCCRPPLTEAGGLGGKEVGSEAPTVSPKMNSATHRQCPPAERPLLPAGRLKKSST